MIIADDWQTWNAAKNSGRKALHQPSGTVWNPATGKAERLAVPTTTEEPPMDLGATLVGLLQTAGTAAINQRFGPQPAASLPQVITGSPVDIPFVDIIPEPNLPAVSGLYYDPAANGGMGKWKRKRKKRCKNLLTPSQAAQLQQLISITGKNSELTKIILARGGLC